MHTENDSIRTPTERTWQNLSSSLTNMSTGDSCPIAFSSYQFVLIPVLYCIIFTLGLVGNSFVIMVLCRQRRPKNVARVYILNLAVADFLALTTLPFWAVYYAYGYNWLFGSAMCKISSSILCLTMFASIFFITCMSLNRYQAIIYPFRTQRGTLHQAFRTVLLVWGLAALASLPTFYFRDIKYIPDLDVTACVMAFPSNKYPQWSAAIALMKNTLGFLIPMAIIITCYILIGVHLMKARALGRNKQKRDRVLKLVASVVMAFLICWLPFHALTFLDALAWMKVFRNCWLVSVIDMALPFGLSMGFANSCINPLLYYFIGSQFQDKLQHLFKLRLSQFKNTQRSFCSTKSSSLQNAETPMDVEHQEGDTERLQTHPL